MDKKLKEQQKILKAIYLEEINKSLFEAKTKNGRCIPYKMVSEIINNSQSTCPWLIRHVINKSFQK